MTVALPLPWARRYDRRPPRAPLKTWVRWMDDLDGGLGLGGRAWDAPEAGSDALVTSSAATGSRDA